MTIRAGLQYLITKWRRLVDDTSACAFTDSEAQDILDANRYDLFGIPLLSVPQSVNNAVVYRVYQSDIPNLESDASGSNAFRIYDGRGNIIPSACYSANWGQGSFVFTSNTGGSALYFDGRTYDLYSAAAQGWEIRAAQTSRYFNFSTGGGSVSKEQYHLHCLNMADRMRQRAWTRQVTLERGDYE